MYTPKEHSNQREEESYYTPIAEAVAHEPTAAPIQRSPNPSSTDSGATEDPNYFLSNFPNLLNQQLTSGGKSSGDTATEDKAADPAKGNMTALLKGYYGQELTADSIPRYKHKNKYPWENEHIRKLHYPTRNERLMDVLNVYGPKMVLKEVTKDATVEETEIMKIEAQKMMDSIHTDTSEDGYGTQKTKLDGLQKEGSELETGIVDDQAAEKQAKADRKAARKVKEYQRIRSKKKRFDKDIGKLDEKIKSAKKRVGWVDVHFKKGTYGEGEEAEKKRDKKKEIYSNRLKELEGKKSDIKLSAEYIKTTFMYYSWVGPTELLPGIMREEWKSKKASLKENSANQKALKKEMETNEEYLSKLDAFAKGPMKKVKKKEVPDTHFKQKEVKEFQEMKYKLRVRGLRNDHDALVGEVLALFAKDPDKQIFPDFMRYSIIHFSGMEYASAHGGWADEKKLLKLLEEKRINEMSPAELDAYEKIALEVMEAAFDDAAEGSKLKKRLKKNIEAMKNAKANAEAHELSGISASIKKNPGKEEVYKTILRMEKERLKLLHGNAGDATVGEIKAKVQEKEKEIETYAKANKVTMWFVKNKIRAKVEEASVMRKKPLIDYAASQIDQLDDLQAMQVLHGMKAEMTKDDKGKEMWREISYYTRLRNDEAQEGFHTDYRKGMDKASLNKSGDDEKEDIKRMKELMYNWRKDSTAWRSAYTEKNEPLTMTLVCDQLAEHVRRAQGITYKADGKDFRWGLDDHARFYMYQQAQSKTDSINYFRHPRSEADLKPGAALFFGKWKDVGASSGHEWNEIDLREWKKEAELTDDQIPDFATDYDIEKIYEEEEYTTKKGETKTRKKLVETINHQKKIKAGMTHRGWKYSLESGRYFRKHTQSGQKQKLVWSHEATIGAVHKNYVITFDTSGYGKSSLGIKGRLKSKILGDQNIFVGNYSKHGSMGMFSEIIGAFEGSDDTERFKMDSDYLNSRY